MIVEKDSFINFIVNIDNSNNKKITIVINNIYTQDELDKYKFFVSLHNHYSRENYDINDKLKPGITNVFDIHSKNLNNNSGSIRIYAIEINKEGYPIKKLFSKKKSLGFYGGANTESLLKFKPTHDLENLLYKVDVIEEMPVVSIYEEEGFNYVEKFILPDYIFKAGILTNIFLDIFELVRNNEELFISNRIEWDDFFKKVEDKTNLKLNNNNREENSNIFAKYLNSFKYRDKLIEDIKSKMESETEN